MFFQAHKLQDHDVVELEYVEEKTEKITVHV